MQPDAPYQPPATPPTEPAFQPPQSQQPEQPQTLPQQQPQPPVEPHNPGKTLAIVGFVFAFVGLQLIGLILSIVALAKSKKAGMTNGLAVAGIILNSVFMLLAALLIAIVFTSYNGTGNSITNRAKTSEARAAALSVRAEVSNYFTEHNGVHPTTGADMTSTRATFNKTPLLGAPADPATVALYTCVDNRGNGIEYWDYVESKAVLIFTEEDLTINDCSFRED